MSFLGSSLHVTHTSAPLRFNKITNLLDLGHIKEKSMLVFSLTVEIFPHAKVFSEVYSSMATSKR